MYIMERKELNNMMDLHDLYTIKYAKENDSNYGRCKTCKHYGNCNYCSDCKTIKLRFTYKYVFPWIGGKRNERMYSYM